MCHQTEPVPGEQDRGQRGAHAFQVGLLGDQVGDRLIPVLGGLTQLTQQVVTGLIVIQRDQCGDHQFGRHLTGGVAAHAVGEGQQPRAGINRVLVVLSNQAAVTAGGVAKDEGHERSSITVLPIRIGTPSGTRVGPLTLARSR